MSSMRCCASARLAVSGTASLAVRGVMTSDTCVPRRLITLDTTRQSVSSICPSRRPISARMASSARLMVLPPWPLAPIRRLSTDSGASTGHMTLVMTSRMRAVAGASRCQCRAPSVFVAHDARVGPVGVAIWYPVDSRVSG